MNSLRAITRQGDWEPHLNQDITNMIRAIAIAPICLAALLSSCVTPYQPRYHQSQMTAAEWDASERAIEAVEDRSFAFRHRERMSDAKATELATRHNPTSVTNQSTNILFW